MGSRSIDFAAEGFFDGLSAAQTNERRELLDWLISEGVSLAELRHAHQHRLLVFLATSRVIGGPRQYTLSELVERTGVDPDLFKALRRAQGLAVPEADEIAYSDLDLWSARATVNWQNRGFTPETMIGNARAIGVVIARVADAMRSVLFEGIKTPGASERDIAAVYATATETMLPLIDEMVSHIVRQHLRNVMGFELAGAIDSSIGRDTGISESTVAFVDLVGFTGLGERIAPDELGLVAENLLAAVQERAAGSVRLVKQLGDGVLLHADDPALLVDLGLALCAEVSGRDDNAPQLRVGITYGPIVGRGGDVYGSAVNLASRLTALARAGSVLANEAVRDLTAAKYRWSSAGTRDLKGFEGPVPVFRARHL